jgi:acid phosphatase (class A)
MLPIIAEKHAAGSPVLESNGFSPKSAFGLGAIAAGFLLLLGFGAAIAQEIPKPFLESRVLIEKVIPPSPELGSNADRRDKRIVERTIRERTVAMCEKARADADLSPFTAYASVLGGGFNAEAYPKLANLLARVGGDTWVAVRDAKAIWNRPRPATANPALVTCAPLPKDGSYPSGHALYSRVTGSIMANLVPSKAKAIRARSHDYAYQRVIAGVHYPSDVEAGERSGDAVFTALMGDPNFKAALEEVRVETAPLRANSR